MSSRLDLHEEFCEILENRNVYFNPPASVKMKYPAIKYSLKEIETEYANGTIYTTRYKYEVTLIDKNPESEYVERILHLPYCRFDRQYPSDNLNHWTFTITR